MARRIEFFYGIGSRYSYLASCRLEQLAEDAGLARALAAEAVAAALDETMLRAHLAGIFGVPTFIVDGEQFWGNDRLPLLAHYLQHAQPAASR